MKNLMIHVIFLIMLIAPVAFADDLTAPEITGISVNASSVRINQSIMFNATVTDDVNVSEVKFAIQAPYGNMNITAINDSVSHFFVICNQNNECKTNQTGQYNLTGIWANDTSNNITSIGNPEKNFIVMEAFGILSSAISWPTSKLNVIQNKTFRINASIECAGPAGAYCGNVTGRARYNLTTSSIDTDVNITDGEKPLFTLSGNPLNCGEMNLGDTCNLSWLVNATGNIGEIHSIDALFESNETIADNQTQSKEVEIIDCTTDVTVSFAGIIFGNETHPLIPNSINNPAANNSEDFYTITVNSGSCTLDIYGNASSMTSESSTQEIGPGNMSFNNQSNDYPSSIRFSSDYQMIFSSLSENITKTIWFWLDMPSVYYGNYTGNFSIESLKQGESPA